MDYIVEIIQIDVLEIDSKDASIATTLHLHDEANDHYYYLPVRFITERDSYHLHLELSRMVKPLDESELINEKVLYWLLSRDVRAIVDHLKATKGVYQSFGNMSIEAAVVNDEDENDTANVQLTANEQIQDFLRDIVYYSVSGYPSNETHVYDKPLVDVTYRKDGTHTYLA